MNVQVNVTVDLGDKTIGVISSLLGNAPRIAETELRAPIGYVQPVPDPTNDEPAPAEEAPKRTRRTRAEIEATKEPEPSQVEEARTPEAPAQVEEPAESADKLEAIKAEVTKYVKKGQSADIKALLSHFGAPKASELAVADYDAFRAMLDRYGKGEAVADIIAGNDDLA